MVWVKSLTPKTLEKTPSLFSLLKYEPWWASWKGAAAILAAILELTIAHYLFHPENDFIGFLDPKNLHKDTKFIIPGVDRSRWTYIGYKDAAAILDAILNYAFLPHIWNVYPSFFQSPMGPLQGSRVKIRGHMIAHRTPLSPRTTADANATHYLLLQ